MSNRPVARKDIGKGHGSTPSETPDPDVADPHPGSVSDGTHPEAKEVEIPRRPPKS